MKLKDIVKIVMGYVSLSTFVISAAITLIWPWKSVAGMTSTTIFLISIMTWGLLGGFKDVNNR